MSPRCRLLRCSFSRHRLIETKATSSPRVANSRTVTVQMVLYHSWFVVVHNWAALFGSTDFLEIFSRIASTLVLAESARELGGRILLLTLVILSRIASTGSVRCKVPVCGLTLCGGCTRSLLCWNACTYTPGVALRRCQQVVSRISRARLGATRHFPLGLRLRLRLSQRSCEQVIGWRIVAETIFWRRRYWAILLRLSRIYSINSQRSVLREQVR